MKLAGIMGKFFIVFTVFVGNIAWAEEIPSSVLDNEKNECVAECRMGGNGQLVCDTLCGCSVDQFAKLSFADFTELQKQISTESLSQENISYLADVGSICVVELDNVMGGLMAVPEVE